MTSGIPIGAWPFFPGAYPPLFSLVPPAGPSQAETGVESHFGTPAPAPHGTELLA